MTPIDFCYSHYPGLLKRNRRSRSRSRSRDSTSSIRSRSSSISPPKYKSDKESRKEDTYKLYNHNDNRKHNINRERDKEDCAKTTDYLEPPPPPRIADVSRETLAKVTPVQMKLATQNKQQSTKGMSVAAVFNNESSDDEIEQMPPECRMRMRNIGRDTPTSSGPNSFGKTKKGFCDSKKIFEKHLRDIYED